MRPSFDWDPGQDAENRRKHGVAFVDPQLAFLDPSRVIARDLSHSGTEEGYFCFGRIADGVLTVRFTYRGSVIRIIGAGYWRRGKKTYEAQAKVHESDPRPIQADCGLSAPAGSTGSEGRRRQGHYLTEQEERRLL
jgi:uncharacterized DUF497 family protein